MSTNEKNEIISCYVEKDKEGKPVVVKRYAPSEKNRKYYTVRPKGGR